MLGGGDEVGVDGLDVPRVGLAAPALHEPLDDRLRLVDLLLRHRRQARARARTARRTTAPSPRPGPGRRGPARRRCRAAGRGPSTARASPPRTARRPGCRRSAPAPGTARPAAGPGRTRRRPAAPRRCRTRPGRSGPRCRRRGSAARRPPCPARRSRSRRRSTPSRPGLKSDIVALLAFRLTMARAVLHLASPGNRSATRGDVLSATSIRRPTCTVRRRRRDCQAVRSAQVIGHGARRDAGPPSTRPRMRREYDRARRARSRPIWPPTGRPSSPRWFADAVAAGLPEPNAMIVATADADGPARAPARCCSRAYDERGFVFFTNYDSRKGTELRGQPVRQPGLPVAPDAAARCVVVRRGRAGRPGRDRGVLRHPAARLAARRLGQPAVAGGARPGGARRRRCAAAERAVRRRTPVPRAAALGRAAGACRRRSSSGRAGSSRLHDRLRYRRTATTAGSSNGSLREQEPSSRRESRAAQRRAGSIDTRPLRRAAYRRLLIGNGVSFFGFQFTAVAVPVQMYAITGSSLWVGLLGVAGLVPLLIFGLWGGAVGRRGRPAQAAAGQLVADLGVDARPAGRRRCSALRSPVAAAGADRGAVGRLRDQLADPAGDHPAARAGRADPGGEHARLHDHHGGRRARPAGRRPDLRRLVDRRRRHGRVRGRRAALHGRVLGDLPAAADPAGRARATARLERPHRPGCAASSTGLRFLVTQPVLLLSFAIDIVAMVLAMPRALFPEVAEDRFGGGSRSAGCTPRSRSARWSAA